MTLLKIVRYNDNKENQQSGCEIFVILKFSRFICSYLEVILASYMACCY